jgi:hypothetical protein
MLKHGGGSIVNTASAAGPIGLPGGTAYMASKHSVAGARTTGCSLFCFHLEWFCGPRPNRPTLLMVGWKLRSRPPWKNQLRIRGDLLKIACLRSFWLA